MPRRCTRPPRREAVWWAHFRRVLVLGLCEPEQLHLRVYHEEPNYTDAPTEKPCGIPTCACVEMKEKSQVHVEQFII